MAEYNSDDIIKESQRFLGPVEDLSEGERIDRILANLKDRAEYAIKSNMSYGDHDILLNIYKFIAEKKYKDATQLYMKKFTILIISGLYVIVIIYHLGVQK